MLVEDNDSNSASKDEYTNAQSTNKETQEIEHIETVAKDPFLGKGRPSKQQFKLFQNADHRTTWLVELWTPWRLLALPIVVFAGFVVSWSASVFLAVNLTQSQVFAAPPYNYSSDTIGRYFVWTGLKLRLISYRIFQFRHLDRDVLRIVNRWTAVRLDLGYIDSQK